jgi:ribosomal protein S18 acetylase RimI-like enzyme
LRASRIAVSPHQKRAATAPGHRRHILRPTRDCPHNDATPAADTAMTDDFRIRTATPDDLDDAARLFDAYRQFYGQPTDPAAGRAFLAERMAQRESVLLLAWQDGRAVGFAQLYPMFSSVRMAPVFVLNDLYVDANARRAGVGRQLLDAAAVAARAAGARRIVLETVVENRVARALYRDAGWDEESTQWYALDLAEPRAHA